MEKRIKFIWKFYGLEAKGTAEHHVIHLTEYSQKCNFRLFETNIEILEEGGFQAFLTLEEPDAISAHAFLKPHEAFTTQ